MRFYFARHGESEANVLRVISNRPGKHGLTEKGRQQAEALAGHLMPAAPAHIYASPLLRAVETAEILSRNLGVDYEITDALREYDCGVIEGKSDPASWQLHRQARDEWIKYRHWESRAAGGENYLEMRARFEPFIQQVLADPRWQQRSLVLISHGGLYSCMLPVVLNNIDLAFADQQPFPNTGYVLAETRSTGLVCLEWCGTPVR